MNWFALNTKLHTDKLIICISGERLNHIFCNFYWVDDTDDSNPLYNPVGVFSRARIMRAKLWNWVRFNCNIPLLKISQKTSCVTYLLKDALCQRQKKKKDYGTPLSGEYSWERGDQISSLHDALLFFGDRFCSKCS